MSIEFEELNILKAGISWSSNSENIIISSSSKGKDLLYVINVKDNKKYNVCKDSLQTLYFYYKNST